MKRQWIILVPLLATHQAYGMEKIIERMEALNIESLRRAAQGGNVIAQNNLGKYHFAQSETVSDRQEKEKHLTLAIGFFEKPAAVGDYMVQSNLAICYLEKSELASDPQDKEKLRDRAIDLLKIAAEKGSITAQYNLGYAYMKKAIFAGKKDIDKATQCIDEAIIWFEKAVVQGDVRAKTNIAACYVMKRETLSDPIHRERYAKSAKHTFAQAGKLGDDMAKGNYCAFKIAVQVCASCGKSAQKKCGGCEAVRYCSTDCQRANWKAHKPTCKANETKN